MKNYLLFIFFLLPGTLLAMQPVQGQEETRLLRFPAAYKNQIVFSYAGDLYSIQSGGGIARKLTSHPGTEMFPKFSPDGKTIAFSAQYDGNTEVYIMPAEGGIPKRITYTATLGRDDVSDRMGPNNIVLGWAPDGKHVIYRSRATTFNDFKGMLWKAPLNGDLSEQIPLSSAGWASYNDDGSKLYFNKVFREFRTWKYYRGGQADDIWSIDFKSGKLENLTQHAAQDIMPMHHQGKIYFASDRDRIMNLFEYDPATKQTKKLTNFTEYDVKFPSIHNGLIAFENAGYIYTYEITTQKQTKVTVQIREDFAVGRNQLVDASKFISSANISPDGKRAVFGASGDVFTVPAEKGTIRNLTHSPGAHDRNVSWSPNGRWIAYISDQTGEDELYMQEQDGSKEAVTISSGGGSYKYGMKWSPDSRFILLSDRSNELYYYDITHKKKTLVIKSDEWEITDFNWSPDSKWLAYTMPSQQGNSRIILYSIESKEHIQATDGWYDAQSPVFSADGKFLYFSSDRTYNPIYSQSEWNHAYVDLSKLYVLHLTSSTSSLYKLENDEVKTEKSEETEKSGTKDKNDKKADDTQEGKVSVKVDKENILKRVEELPVQAGNFWNLQPVKNGIYYHFAGHGKPMAVKFFSNDDKKESNVGNFSTFKLSADLSKVLVGKGNKYYIESPGTSDMFVQKELNFSDLKVTVDRQAEWRQIYYESWRQMRDYFYDPGMHGANWEQVKKKYDALLPYVQHRNDLNYLIGEMIGELNAGHAYVNGGDRPDVASVPMGLLGAKLKRDKSNYYRIEKILNGPGWAEGQRSPLAEIGLNINEGNFILAVNGKDVRQLDNIYAALIGKANETVEVTINTEASEKGGRKVYVKPLASEADLYYADWIQDNIAKVNKASDGKVGYLHIPDMGAVGLSAFSRYFYPQLQKEALLIDDRGNGGGNVSPMIIERLRRELVFGNSWRNSSVASTRPAQIHLGPKVCLIDQFSASDGDLFPYQFRHYKIGKLIGQRSWGGVVGIRGSLPFIDGGTLNRPEFAHFNPETNEWVIEGEGVSPDIEVLNDPYQEFLGNDIQLKRGVEELLKELKANPTKKLTIPPFPKKN